MKQCSSMAQRALRAGSRFNLQSILVLEESSARDGTKVNWRTGMAPLGADAVIPFTMDPFHQAAGGKQYEKTLIAEFTHGIDVVVDYLWGQSAKIVIVAIARAVEDARPVRFVHAFGGATPRGGTSSCRARRSRSPLPFS